MNLTPGAYNQVNFTVEEREAIAYALNSETVQAFIRDRYAMLRDGLIGVNSIDLLDPQDNGARSERTLSFLAGAQAMAEQLLAITKSIETNESK